VVPATPQTPIDASHQPLTPRIERVEGGETYSSLSDLKAVVTATRIGTGIRFEARGKLQSPAGASPPSGEIAYELVYDIAEAGVTLTARADGAARLIVPVVSRRDERVACPHPHAIVIGKAAGVLSITSLSDQPFEPVSTDRIFNMVPGFQAVVAALPLKPGQSAGVTLRQALS
jgi:hypothetical protein